MKVISILLLDRIIPRKEQHKIKNARVKNFKRPNSTITTNQPTTNRYIKYYRDNINILGNINII